MAQSIRILKLVRARMGGWIVAADGWLWRARAQTTATRGARGHKDQLRRVDPSAARVAGGPAVVAHVSVNLLHVLPGSKLPGRPRRSGVRVIHA